MLTLPVFYYPTTLVWVDDDGLFLKALSPAAGDTQRIEAFNSPRECIQFFERYELPMGDLPFLRSCTEHDHYETATHTPVDLNVPSLCGVHEHTMRQAEVSVMIVDYHMPEMNGIELCRAIKTPGIKKILLTGEANHQDAVAAFNDNTIDRFIRKDSPTLIEDIRSYISFLSYQYFREKTLGLLVHLEASERIAISDKVFISFFNSWCLENGVVEYSVIDKGGSVLTIDEQGVRRVFVVQTEKSLDAFVSLNEETNGAEAVVRAVKERRRIPFFGIGRECWEVDVEDWGQHLYQFAVIEGRERYYWGVVSHQEAKNI